MSKIHSCMFQRFIGCSIAQYWVLSFFTLGLSQPDEVRKAVAEALKVGKCRTARESLFFLFFFPIAVLNAILLHLLTRAGYRHIDCAYIYQNEHEVGQAFSQSTVPREEIFVTSKVRTRKRNISQGKVNVKAGLTLICSALFPLPVLS